MSMTIPDLTDCKNQRYMAGAAGAITGVTRLEKAIPMFPPEVHWALAGAATDVYCKGQLEFDKQLAFCALGGVIGAIAGKCILTTLRPAVRTMAVPMGIPV